MKGADLESSARVPSVFFQTSPTSYWEFLGDRKKSLYSSESGGIAVSFYGSVEGGFLENRRERVGMEELVEKQANKPAA